MFPRVPSRFGIPVYFRQHISACVAQRSWAFPHWRHTAVSRNFFCCRAMMNWRPRSRTGIVCWPGLKWITRVLRRVKSEDPNELAGRRGSHFLTTCGTARCDQTAGKWLAFVFPVSRPEVTNAWKEHQGAAIWQRSFAWLGGGRCIGRARKMMGLDVAALEDSCTGSMWLRWDSAGWGWQRVEGTRRG